VTLGETLGDMRAVTAGVEVGQRVIVSPPEKLKNGDAVALAEG